MPNSIDIREDTPVGTDVFSVHVIDKDVEFGGEKLTYSLTDPVFEIDPDTGDEMEWPFFGL